MEDLRRPSCDSLALCDPMRRRSSEEDSLPDSCVDSGMSTLCSNNGYDYEHERTSCPSPAQAEDSNTTVSGDTSDTEVGYISKSDRTNTTDNLTFLLKGFHLIYNIAHPCCKDVYFSIL